MLKYSYFTMSVSVPEIDKFKTPPSKFRQTLNKGSYARYKEDTISAYNKQDKMLKELNFSKSESECILREIGFIIIRKILSSNLGFDFPNKLGAIRIVGVKGKSVNRGLSSKIGKRIYNNNSATQNVIFRPVYYWNSIWKFQNILQFKSSYGLRQGILHQVKKGYMHFSVFGTYKESVLSSR